MLPSLYQNNTNGTFERVYFVLMNGAIAVYTLAYIHRLPWGHGLKGDIHMITLATFMYTQLLDIYIIYKIDTYNYQLLYDTSSFLQ